MFVSNVTPAIIVAGAAGFGFGSNSPDFPQLIYLIQMSMLFAGIATLFQTIGLGPVGARLPVVQGTSFAFIPIMIPLVAGKGVEALACALWRRADRRAVPRSAGHLDRPHPLCAAAAGDRSGGHDDRAGAGQGRNPVCRRRRPAIDKPEYGSLLNWSARAGGHLCHAGPEVLHPRHAGGRRGALGLMVGYV